MKPLKTRRIFVLIWAILALSVLASIYWLIPSISRYSTYPKSIWITRSVWIMLLRLTNTGILIIISLKLWKIVKAYTEKNQWQANFYHKLRQVGYWAIVLTLLFPFFQIAITLSSLHVSLKYDTQQYAIYILMYGMGILTESPAMWVLTLSVFLFAELLKVANEVKAENESII